MILKQHQLNNTPNSTAGTGCQQPLVRLVDVPGSVRKIFWRRSDRAASDAAFEEADKLRAEGWECLKGPDIDGMFDFIAIYWKANV